MTPKSNDDRLVMPEWQMYGFTDLRFPWKGKSVDVPIEGPCVLIFLGSVKNPSK